MKGSQIICPLTKTVLYLFNTPHAYPVVQVRGGVAHASEKVIDCILA